MCFGRATYRFEVRIVLLDTDLLNYIILGEKTFQNANCFVFCYLITQMLTKILPRVLFWKIARSDEN